MIKGVIFDFNGTLFWDSNWHDKAWNTFTNNNSLKCRTDREKRTYMHGKGNSEILNYVFGKTLSAKEVDQFTIEKETLYRDLVLSDQSNLCLAPGATVLLEHLKLNGVPMTIATSSEKTNVDFFFKHLNLYNWFEYEKVVFDDGSIDAKPAPDIFLKASEKINTPIEQCIVLEDSLAGILAAKKAGAGRIIFVENDSPIDFSEICNYIDNRVKRLDEIIEFI